MKILKFDFCGNMGGAHKIYAIPPGSLAGILHNHTQGKTTLNLNGNNDLIEIYCTPDTLQLTEEKTQTAAGTAYAVTITGVHPKTDAPDREQLAILQSGYWLVLLEDNNGNILLAGDEKSFLIFNSTATTGQAIQNRNQLQFTFSGVQPYPCCFINEIAFMS